MEIESSFHVEAPPDRVYAFLLDVNGVAACMPGAELSEVVDPNTFRGRVKIKVGPIVTSYSGVARIVSRDEPNRTAVLQAEGREAQGAGSVRATAAMTVQAEGTGSHVVLSTSLNVAGRVAQFGRGVMEDVSRRLVADMAECIRACIETPSPEEATASQPSGQGGLPTATGTRPVNALALIWAIIIGRLGALFGRHKEEGSRA